MFYFFVPFCSCIVCFCCVRFNFSGTKPRDWLGKDLFSVQWDVKPHLSNQAGGWPAASLLG